MYTTINFKTKKALRDAINDWNQFQTLGEIAYMEQHGMLPSQIGAMLNKSRAKPKPVTYYQPNDMGFAPTPRDGVIYLEGPHYPEPHKWYAQCEAKDGKIVRIIK